MREVPEAWYHAHLQAVGRAQGRYLLMLLLIAAYSLGLRFSTGETVNVAFLGLAVPKAIVNAFAVLVLSVLLLALFGTFEAARLAFNDLRDRMGVDETEENRASGTKEGPRRFTLLPGQGMGPIDEHPNVADFLSYATLVEGQGSPLTNPLGLVLYPLPMAAVFAWTVLLWWTGICTRPRNPEWLLWVYVGSVPVLVGNVVRFFLFMRRRWRMFKEARANSTAIGAPS